MAAPARLLLPWRHRPHPPRIRPASSSPARFGTRADGHRTRPPGEYYDAILEALGRHSNNIRDRSPASPPPRPAQEQPPLHGHDPAPSPAPPPQPGAAAERQARARIIFGSRLAGPGTSAPSDSAGSDGGRTVVAGVVVPPRPEEPDNCCMSGCVNCVWERYREDMEAWAAADKEAKRRLAAGAEAGAETEAGAGAETGAGRGAKDAGRSGPSGGWDEGGLYGGVPVGIREFMRHEKRLKEMRSGGGGDRIQGV